MAQAYDGPSVKEMIANHSMAENIVKYQDASTGENAILDNGEMERLKRFVNDPVNQRSAIMAETGQEESPAAGENNRPNHLGSLVGYIAFKHGKEDGEALTGDEIAKLRQWFAMN